LDSNNLKQRVKGAITDMLSSGGVCDEKVAKGLNMSTRSLQRKLQGMNTSFGKLLEEVRRELAEHYIEDISVSLLEVAFICGFSVYSSFSRAYKRWTGISPNEKRKQFFQ
jgi:AraC-like DNA-binding protein